MKSKYKTFNNNNNNSSFNCNNNNNINLNWCFVKSKYKTFNNNNNSFNFNNNNNINLNWCFVKSKYKTFNNNNNRVKSIIISVLHAAEALWSKSMKLMNPIYCITVGGCDWDTQNHGLGRSLERLLSSLIWWVSGQNLGYNRLDYFVVNLVEVQFWKCKPCFLLHCG